MKNKIKPTLQQRKDRAGYAFAIEFHKLIDDFKFKEDPKLKFTRNEKILLAAEIIFKNIEIVIKK